MAKSRTVKRASLHSRAARRATSPSINTDKSLKNAKPPQLPGANILHNVTPSKPHSFTHASTSTSANPQLLIGTGAGTGAGITKQRGKKTARMSRDQRLRLEKAVLRAESVREKMGRKVEGSRRRERVVKDRSGAWEDINGRIVGRGKRKGAGKGLVGGGEIDGDGSGNENGDWEDAGDSEEEQVIERVGRMKVVDDAMAGFGTMRDQTRPGGDEEDQDVVL